MLKKRHDSSLIVDQAKEHEQSALYRHVRELSLTLSNHLSDSDQTPQSMPDASPTKWHLAHTTWFFETFILEPHVTNYQIFDDDFCYLFNSYYEQAGPRHARVHRGMITRPDMKRVRDYRLYVDDAMMRFMQSDQAQEPHIANLITLGCHHEQQHQELLLTDILHLFSLNPTKPAYAQWQKPQATTLNPIEQSWYNYDEQMVTIGFQDDDAIFHYDNETPPHQHYCQAFSLSSCLVTNHDYCEFIEDGGYDNPLLWLSDGWAKIQQDHWHAPLYWQKDQHEQWQSMSLWGLQDIDLNAPICHISYFEADAFARWAGYRLPREHEWELVAQKADTKSGNNLSSGHLRPISACSDHHNSENPSQLFGDVWEWTASSYLGYPGFKTAKGAVGEYNGKFMCGQFVLRGGSCVTPAGHIRSSYRNFFYPHQRWQFAGIRLAK